MKKLFTAAAAAFALGAFAQDDAYLMVYFTDPSHSLHMATSRDGRTFTAVNSGMPVIAGDSIAEQRGIRDPHIYRAPDGSYCIAMTDLHIFAQGLGYRDTKWERPEKYGWGNNRALVLMKSRDLIHWTHSSVRIDKAFPEQFGDLGCAWAPQTIYDPEAGKLMVYFTIRPTGDGKTGLYYSYANDDFTRLETVPQRLYEYPDSNIQILDADICPMPDGRYCMTYVSQENPGGIKVAYSDRINGGYDYHHEQVDFEPQACEAPNMWQGPDGKWVLMYDVFSINPHNFGFAETEDFKTFTPLGRFNEDGPMVATNFISPKHGAVVKISAQECDKLEQYWKEHPSTVDVEDIILSDPCVLPYAPDSTYYMTGTGGKLWKSRDLKHWSGPMTVAITDPDSWMGRKPEIWAAELHEYQGKYYYFATFTNNDIIIDHVQDRDVPRRAVHVLMADHPEGPYRYVSDENYLPADMATLDGTLWVEPDGTPYMVYCHEWVQTVDGTMEYRRLKRDLSGAEGDCSLLFRASDSPWSHEILDGKEVRSRVTDGPWLFRTDTGRLGMMWTSWVYGDYTQGVAYSQSGSVAGPWVQQAEPITPPNYGHCMLFRAFDGRTLMSGHTHSVDDKGRYIRRPHFCEVDLTGDKLKIVNF